MTAVAPAAVAAVAPVPGVDAQAGCAAAEAWYVYAVIAIESEAPPVPGVLPGCDVRLVPFGPLAVLASRVPRALFEAASATNRMNEPDWVAERAAAHHAVIGAAGPCLPMRLGVLFSDLDAVRAWLAPRAGLLTPALAQAARQTEWVLSLHEDPDRLAAWLDVHDPAVQAILQTCAERGEGTRFLLVRKLDKAREAGRRQCLDQVRSIVDRWARAAGLMALPETSRQGVPAWTVMLPNERARLLSGDADLPSGLPDGLSWHLSGPWPNYALATAITAQPTHG